MLLAGLRGQGGVLLLQEFGEGFPALVESRGAALPCSLEVFHDEGDAPVVPRALRNSGIGKCWTFV